MAYAQWIIIHLINSMTSSTLKVKNAIPDKEKGEGWGKFYKDGNKDDEISAAEVNKVTVPPGGSANIYSCGRSDAASGTEGHIELWDGESKIGKVYWDCPWGSKSNDFGISERGNSYWVQNGAWSKDSGAIGTVDVEIGKKG
ncbi:Asp-hemolysin [Aspergillus sergii]|uniref:Asp-hemolysin n=1 Tax=Aspergillus sergii TaxID=1034303 RepID=A0A5N6XGR4_9EURO|nr:Asp-hemolysin [Aspergillus sergii]